MPHQCTSCGHVFADGSKEMLSGCPDCGGTKFQFHPEGADIPDHPDPEAEPPDPPTPDDSVTGAVGNAAATVKDLVGRSGSGGQPEERPATEDPSTTSETAGDVALETDASTAQSTAATEDTGDRTAAPEPAERTDATGSTEVEAEDSAQATARSDFVSPDELPDSSGGATGDARATEASAEHPTAPGSEPSAGPSTTTPEKGDGSSDSGTTAPAGEPDDSDERPDLNELRRELNEQFESIKVVEPGQYELNLMELYDREEYIIALEEDGKYSIQVPDRWQD